MAFISRIRAKQIEKICRSAMKGSSNIFSNLDWEIANSTEINVNETIDGPIEHHRAETEYLIARIEDMKVSFARRAEFIRDGGYNRVHMGNNYSVEFYLNDELLYREESERLKEIYQSLELNIALENFCKPRIHKS